jgi:hypothetical protein
MKSNPCTITVLAIIAGSTLGYAQPVIIPELEPNDSKDTATAVDRGGPGLRAFPVPLDSDSFVGSSTGNDTSGGPASTDFYLIKSGDEPKDFYCYYLEEKVGSSAEMSLRGLIQSFGVILPFTDAAVQTPSSTPIKTIWYGVGAQERLYFRVSGRTAGPSNYQLEYRCEPYPPGAPDPGSPDTWPAGALTLIASAPNNIDMDLWVYNAQLEPIPGFGHDAPDGVGLTRNFAAGEYYVAVTDGNLLNNLPSPPSDANRNKPVLDFPNIIASGSSVFPINGIRLAVSGGGVSGTFTVNKTHPWQVFFFRVIVADPNACPVCPADYNNDGGVDGGDVQVFFADWTGAASCADVNADGGIDGSDVEFFFERWSAGGC